MYGCTDPFLTRHVRNLATLEGGAGRDNVIRYAGITLSARQEEFGHENPNTVMFMQPQTLGQIQQFLAGVGANNHFNCNVRIPFVVTWTGHATYEIVDNAAGFKGDTDGAGLCAHYAGRMVDAASQVNTWRAPGI